MNYGYIIWYDEELNMTLDNVINTNHEDKGLSHRDLAIYIKKYLKAKEELWKLKYFTMQK
jgi:hypothetical protein